MTNPNSATGEKLELRYVPLDTVVNWDRNPKKHDYSAMLESDEILLKL